MKTFRKSNHCSDIFCITMATVQLEILVYHSINNKELGLRPVLMICSTFKTSDLKTVIHHPKFRVMYHCLEVTCFKKADLFVHTLLMKSYLFIGLAVLSTVGSCFASSSIILAILGEELERCSPRFFSRGSSCSLAVYVPDVCPTNKEISP